MAEKLRVLFRCVVTAVAIARLGTGVVPRQAAASDLFEIQVVDQQTHRGIPMVEVKTVDDVALMTDSAGRVALDVTGLDNQQVYFAISSPGYELKPDGFGFHGVRLNVRRGGTATVELQRTLPAERLYRVTGRNIYGDSVRLEKPVPLASPLIAGGVVGQDSVQVVPYHDQLYWFWGDTNRIGYPLGLFRTAGATSGLPGRGGLAADVGVDLTYFTNQTGFARAMVDAPDAEGVVWIDGVCTVKDDQGRERLVTHYSRRKGLADQLEHGLAVFNDDRQTFEVLQVLPLEEEWRVIRSHPIHVTDEGVDYLMFGDPFLTTRVPATLSAIQDPQQYQSFVCTTGGDPKQATPSRNTAGMLDWHWARLPPVTQKDEQRWLKQGLVQQEELRFLPGSRADPSHRVLMHGGSVQWNEFRQRWILIAIEYGMRKGSPSLLGEVWYAEAESPQGPFQSAVQIATHPGQSFYNPVHHRFLDQEGGRYIYFEGTFCNTFTNSPAVPAYNYNQLMYRLDLSAARLHRN